MLKIGEKTFDSRLLLGTGKYTNATVQQEAIDASASNLDVRYPETRHL